MPSYDRYILSDEILDLMAKAQHRTFEPTELALRLDKTVQQVKTAIAKLCMQERIHAAAWQSYRNQNSGKTVYELVYRYGKGDGVYPDRKELEKADKPTRFSKGGWPIPDSEVWNGTNSVFNPNVT